MQHLYVKAFISLKKKTMSLSVFPKIQQKILTKYIASLTHIHKPTFFSILKDCTIF